VYPSPAPPLLPRARPAPTCPALSWQAAAVGNLPPFLRHLTAQVRSAVPGGMVIWYDSVLRNGALKWQNELNEENR